MTACLDAPRSEATATVESSSSSASPVVGERIDGPANVRDTVNGKHIFTLFDKALVDNLTLENDWYRVGIYADIDTSEFGMDSIHPGRKILVDGEVIGEVVKTMSATTSHGGKKAWVFLYGYTHMENIDPESIIEPELEKYIQHSNGARTLRSWQPFIDRFALQDDSDFLGYRLFSNYENSFDDPSPSFRIGLAFEKDRLVAILHSRPIRVLGTQENLLDGAFDCVTYPDFAQREKFLMDLQAWMNSVD
jgi:hypothetical protein